MFKSKRKKKVAPAAQPEPEPPAAERRLSQDKQEVQMMRGISDFQMEGVVDVDADEQSDLELLIDMVKDGCSAAEIAAEATPENCAYVKRTLLLPTNIATSNSLLASPGTPTQRARRPCTTPPRWATRRCWRRCARAGATPTRPSPTGRRACTSRAST